MHRLILAFPLLALLAFTAGAQEAITIKIAYPRAGQRSKVTIEEKSTTRSVFTVAGMNQAKDEEKTKSLIYVDEIVENPGNARCATKLKRTFEKAVLGKDGRTARLLVEGKTVLIEKRGDKYSFTIDGKAVTGDAQRILDGEFNRSSQEEVRDIMFPKKPVKPGESWTIEPAAILKAIGEQGPSFAKDKVTATGTLTKAYRKDGRQFGVIEFTFDGPLTGLGEKNPITLKNGTMTMKLAGEGCIDGSVSTGKSTTRTAINLAGSTMGVDLTISVESTENRTVEALPAK